MAINYMHGYNMVEVQNHYTGISIWQNVASVTGANYCLNT